MYTHLKKFVIRTGLMAAVLFIAGALFFKFTPVNWYHNGFIFLLAGYLFFSWAIQYFLYRYTTKRLAVFNRAFMLLTGIKLLVLIGAMGLIAYLVTPYFKYFLGELLLLYLIFSIVEIKDMLNVLKAQKNKKN